MGLVVSVDFGLPSCFLETFFLRILYSSEPRLDKRIKQKNSMLQVKHILSLLNLNINFIEFILTTGGEGIENHTCYVLDFFFVSTFELNITFVSLAILRTTVSLLSLNSTTFP